MVGYLTVLPNMLWADRETCHVVLRRVKRTVSKANHHSRPQGVFQIHVGKISHMGTYAKGLLSVAAKQTTGAVIRNGGTAGR